LSIQHKYRTFWPRFGAGILDGFALGFISLIITLILPNQGVLKNLQVELLLVAPTLYYTICHWYFGQTWGKKLNRIVVVDISEKKRLSFHQSLSRQIVGWLEILNLVFPFILNLFPLVAALLVWLNVFWFPLEILTMLSNSKRRALHDILARSVVVREEYIDMQLITRPLTRRPLNLSP